MTDEDREQLAKLLKEKIGERVKTLAEKRARVEKALTEDFVAFCQQHAEDIKDAKDLTITLSIWAAEQLASVLILMEQLGVPGLADAVAGGCRKPFDPQAAAPPEAGPFGTVTKKGVC